MKNNQYLTEDQYDTIRRVYPSVCAAINKTGWPDDAELLAVDMEGKHHSFVRKVIDADKIEALVIDMNEVMVGLPMDRYILVTSHNINKAQGVTIINASNIEELDDLLN
jgi:hypothetical protein